LFPSVAVIVAREGGCEYKIKKERERRRRERGATLQNTSLSVISSFRAFKTSFIDEIKRTFICVSEI